LRTVRASRSEAEEAHRRARARIEEAERGSSRNEGQRELALAQRERDKSVQVAEQRLAKQAAEIFACLEREVGRLQERARRIVAAAASKELERRVQGSVESALREIEERLTATMRGGVGGGIARRADTGARRPATERSARRPEGRRDGQVHLG
jgi:predicted transcriptional regulator